MKLFCIIAVVLVVFLPIICDVVFTDPTTQYLDGTQGEPTDAAALTHTTDGAATDGGGLAFPSAAAPRLIDYPAVVFIVSTEREHITSAMNTVAILCYTVPLGDGVFSWQGSAKSWAPFDRLHYRLHAIGDADGLTSVTAEQYVLGEKTDTPVYVRQVVGVGV